MSAVWMRFRAELRGRWRAWLGLAILIGVFGGAVIAAAAGAVRTDSVVDRSIEKLPPPDIFLLREGVTGSAEDPEALAEALRFENLISRPSVAQGARAFILPAEVEGVEILASDDPRVLRSIFPVKLLEGRRPDPTRVDEAIVNERAARTLGVKPGDEYTIRFLSGFPFFGPARPGPVVRFRITGVQIFLGDVAAIAEPSISLTPAFLERYGDQIPDRLELSMLRLRHGSASFESFDKEIQELSRGQTVFYVRASWDEARRSFGLQAAALWILAAILALVTVLVLGQTIARQTFLESSDHPVLRALGVSQGRLFMLGMIRAALIGLTGAALAVLAAASASPLTPFGNARLVDPDAGFSAAALPSLLGFAGVALGAIGLAAWPSWRAARSAAGVLGSTQQTASARPSFAERLSRLARRPTARIGVRMALEPGRGRTAVPVRTTITATTVGVLALIAAMVVGSSLDRLTKTPRLYGWNWDVIVSIESEDDADVQGELQGFASAETRDALLGIPGVAEASFGPLGGQILLDGLSMEPYGLSIGAPVRPPILEGRAPAAPNEIAVARKSLRALEKDVGDVVQFGFPGTEARAEFRIVGVTVLPIVASDISSLGEGAWVTLEGVESLFGGTVPMDGALVRFVSGSDPRAVEAAIVGRFGPGSIEKATPPGTVVDFGRVANMPYVLVGVVALLAAGTLAHGLVTAVRRRRHDLAVLKTLGFDRGQVRRAVAWQATATAVLTAAIAIPLGAITGRWVWILFANQAGFVADPVVDLSRIGLTFAAAILVANVVAALPARAAARTQPAVVLRSE